MSKTFVRIKDNDVLAVETDSTRIELRATSNPAQKDMDRATLARK